MSKLENYDVGCIVGRFQVPDLHEGHIKLINEVCNRHGGRVIIFIGVSPAIGTKENPLDYRMRKEMIEDEFPSIVVLPILDCSDDKIWSRNLDNSVRTVFPIGSVCLYGGRDSFLKSYCGNLDAREFPTHDYRPGSEVRAAIGKECINSEEFRAGAIWQTQNQFKRTYITIDVAIYKNDAKGIQILLGRKHNEKGFRFPGGFVEGETLEETVRREAQEETGVALEGPVEFIGSFIVNDWRYRNTSDSILTNFFASEYTWGGHVSNEEASDDLEEIRWFSLIEAHNKRKDLIVESHMMLIEALYKYHGTKGKK